MAGAGSGKTMTLAARVASLIERGTRPERILLLTFSRRAAREMVSRAERLTRKDDPGRVWGGTFHAVGNRLLRIHGRALGLTPDFTVLDQADGADVMNLLRDELGFSSRERRFPRKDTLAAIYSRTVNAGERLVDVLQRPLSVVPRRSRGDPRHLPRLHRAQAPSARPRLRRPSPVLEGARDVARHRTAARRDVRSRPGRRVPGHERAAGRHPRGDAAARRSAEPHGRRRRRPGDLRVPRRHREEHPRVPRTLPGHDDRQARTELPIDAAHPRGVERGDRPQPAAAREDAPIHARGRGAPRAPRVSRRSRAERRRLPGGARASGGGRSR